EIEDYLQAASSESFNLEQSPLIRISLLNISDNENLFFLSMHHIIGDGWSTELLVSEIVDNYNKLLKDEDSKDNEMQEEAPLSIQYKDYTIWR
ncbi:condensation domain-containing protein, partial [Bacillus sp. SIMBA_031]